MTGFFHLQPKSHKRKKAYQFGKLLGKGGYGEVFQAHCLEDGLEYAVKIVSKEHITNMSLQKTRMNELMGIQHRHIVKLKEWFESTNNLFMIFEVCLGGELYEHVMDEGRFKEAEAREVALALTSAVKYLHDRRVVHRDLKLENVLYRQPPGKNGACHSDCVISDFGLASVLEHEDSLLHSHCGSAGYTAPEVYDTTGYGRPADMWSLGVVIFATMGGRFPYKQTEPLRLAYEARTTKLHFPKQAWESISADAKDFISKLLVVNTEKRMTASEAMLHPWLSDGPEEPGAVLYDSTTVSSSIFPKIERRETKYEPPTPASTATTDSGLGGESSEKEEGDGEGGNESSSDNLAAKAGTNGEPLEKQVTRQSEKEPRVCVL